MFKDTDIYASFSVDDLAKAKTFYGQTLGLEVIEIPQAHILQLNVKGDRRVVVYATKNRKPADFTVLNFPVSDIEKTMKQLRDKGITFEVYTEGDTLTDTNGIATFGPVKAAWFKDPAGNILALHQGV